MKKHLIIHGDTRSGKTLFINSLINKKFGDAHRQINGKFLKKRDLTTEAILKIAKSLGRENCAVYFNDIIPKITYDHFVACASELGSCRMILEYGMELPDLELNSSLLRRFDVINTNTISYKELMKFLNN